MIPTKCHNCENMTFSARYTVDIKVEDGEARIDEWIAIVPQPTEAIARLATLADTYDANLSKTYRELQGIIDLLKKDPVVILRDIPGDSDTDFACDECDEIQ